MRIGKLIWNIIVVQHKVLIHWGRVTHRCVSKRTIIGSDNGLSPSRRQAIIWTYAGILSIQLSGTNFSEILTEIDVFSFKEMHLKMAAILSQPHGVNQAQPQVAQGERSVWE